MFDSTTASDEPVVTHEAGAQVITIRSESDSCAGPIVSAVSHQSEESSGSESPAKPSIPVSGPQIWFDLF